MYKNYTRKQGIHISCFQKILLVMRLTTVILIAAIMQVSASGFAQRVTFSAKDATLKQLFREIKRQTGYNVIWSTGRINPNEQITVNFKNASIDEVLTTSLSRQSVAYTIDQKTIVIKEKTPSFLDRVVSAFAAIDIRGAVLDEKGQPLLGATVKVKNTRTVVSTNANGEFQLNDINENAVLQISFIGYKTKEIAVGQSRNITVKLELSTADLEGVTVISTGYQTLSKERSTGSYNVISGEQLDRPATNIAQRLIGTTAGMQAILDANGNPRFEIRGQTSLNIRDNRGNLTANAFPLVVVDGFAIQGDFSTINPNDIESVTILKDAAAASIWGAKSANGVIVVVTKKVKRGVPLKVDFSAFTRISKKLDLDYVNPLAPSNETVDYEMKAFGNWSGLTNSGSLTSGNVSFTASPATMALNEFLLGFITAGQRDALLAKYRTQSNKDQISDELLTNPMTQQYNLNLSGATGKVSNNVSFLYEDNKSNFKFTNDKKYTFNYRGNADIFKWLEFSFSSMVNYNKINNGGVQLSDIQGMAPYEMLRNEDGSLTNIAKNYTPIIQRLVPTALFPYPDFTYNPIQEIANRKITSEQLNTRLQAGLKFKIIKGLSVDSKVQYELFNTTNRRFRNENTFSVRDSVNRFATWDQATNKITLNLPKGGMLDQNRRRTEAYTLRNQVNFDRKFNDDHEVNFVAGSEINSILTETFVNPTTFGYNEETLSVGTLPNGPGGTTFPIKNWLGANQTIGYSNGFTSFTERYFSLFGNAAYTYKDKYTVSGSVRTDASNLITDDPSYRYGPFWSVGLGWQASKERFMRNVNWVDRLTVRATYGYNGNVDRSTSFMPLIGMQPIPNATTGDITATISSFGNPTLRWEKTGTWNVGLDYSLFKGALYGKVDVYNKSGKDLIATLSIPAANGTTSQKLNNAEMTNKGIELELGTRKKIKGNDITWTGNLNFSYNKNTVTKLFLADYDASTLTFGGSGAYVEGENSSTLWRYKYAGIQNAQPMIYGPSGPTQTFYDFSSFTPGDGRTYLVNTGTTVAPYTLGLINSFQVYDFNVSFIVTGKFGHVFSRKGFNYPPTFAARTLPNNKLSEVVNGDPMQIVPLPLNLIEPMYFFWGNFTQNLSYLVENASHIRMQEVNVSYNIPQRLLSKFKMNRLQVFAQGNDLFTIVSNNAGEDPEYPLGTLKPQARLSLGIKCEF
jgi:TonB-linked SusC/RagA family outer membrane protein